MLTRPINGLTLTCTQALTEKMVALPFECGLQTIQYVMTLGATSFLAFIYANIVELAVMVFMRVAVKPMQFKLQVCCCFT